MNVLVERLKSKVGELSCRLRRIGRRVDAAIWELLEALGGMMP